jgi:hypothetical protein
MKNQDYKKSFSTKVNAKEAIENIAKVGDW